MEQLQHVRHQNVTEHSTISGHRISKRGCFLWCGSGTLKCLLMWLS